jgi:hypothetical protein
MDPAHGEVTEVKRDEAGIVRRVRVRDERTGQVTTWCRPPGHKYGQATEPFRCDHWGHGATLTLGKHPPIADTAGVPAE